MLDLKLIRSEPERIKAALARRGAADQIDELLSLDERRRQLLPEIEAKLVGGIEDLGANILAVLPAIDHAVAELTRNSVANDDIDEFENLFSDA